MVDVSVTDVLDLTGCAVSCVHVSWPQRYVLRIRHGLIVEHGAVRDDFSVITKPRRLPHETRPNRRRRNQTDKL
jgi:hypothetical protein